MVSHFSEDMTFSFRGIIIGVYYNYRNIYSAMCSAAQKNEADIVVRGYYNIFEDIFIMHRLFDNANQVYVIIRVIGGFIAYVFCRCRGWSFIGYANSVHICFFLSVALFFGISLTQITRREIKMFEKSVFGTGFCKF